MSSQNYAEPRFKFPHNISQITCPKIPQQDGELKVRVLGPRASHVAVSFDAILGIRWQPILRKGEGLAIQVNFSRSLAQVIREIKYLDSMGFNLPEFSLSVTLQEDKYDKDLEGLQSMLQV